jgi:methyl-accepting chemotaxis protein
MKEFDNNCRINISRLNVIPKGDWALEKKFLSYFIFLIITVLIVVDLIVLKYTESLVLSVIIAFLISGIIYLMKFRLHKGTASDIKDIIRRINENDLIVETNFQEKANDDELSLEIKKMVDGLKENFRKQVNMATHIVEVSSDLTNIAGESSEAMNNIQAFSEVTCESSERQVNMIQKVSDNANNIVSILQNMTGEMDDTESFAEDSIVTAKQGMNATANIQKKMGGMRELVSNTAVQIESLREYSEKVVNMTGLISSIAQQTNMLALNASIEAARAGEHGRGFSVVADEVGKLSNQTTQVSNEISEVVFTLQKEILTIANMMKQEIKHVEEGYIEVKNTIKDFDRINHSLKSSLERIKQMSQEIKSINKSGEEVATSINEIVEFSNEIYSQMEESQAQVSIHNEKIVNLKEIAGKLNKDADDMQQYVASKVMEGKMLRSILHVKKELEGKPKDNDNLIKLSKEVGLDIIYITDKEGAVEYCSQKEFIGINLHKLNQRLVGLKEGKLNYISTPIIKRIQDGRLYKYLCIVDNEGRIYQAALSIDSLLKF